MAPPITLGVLAERLGSVQAGVDDIKKDLKVVADQALDRRVKSLEDKMQWVTRTIGGVLISGAAGIVFALVTR